MSETKAGYVQAKARNKSNTQDRIQINGTWYGVDRGANTDGIAQGVYVEYQLGGFTSRNGQWVPTIARVRPVSAPAGSTPPVNGSNGHASKLKSAAWDDSALRFISNVVGCAIESGKCDTPLQVSDWSLAAQDALLRLTGERIQEQAAAPGIPGQQSPPPSSGDPEGWDDLAPPSRAQGSAPPSDW